MNKDNVCPITAVHWAPTQCQALCQGLHTRVSITCCLLSSKGNVISIPFLQRVCSGSAKPIRAHTLYMFVRHRSPWTFLFQFWLLSFLGFKVISIQKWLFYYQFSEECSNSWPWISVKYTFRDFQRTEGKDLRTCKVSLQDLGILYAFVELS